MARSPAGRRRVDPIPLRAKPNRAAACVAGSCTVGCNDQTASLFAILPIVYS